jgi:hypothetical protein
MKRALLLMVALAACTKTETVPGLVVQVLTDLPVPDRLDSVELQVRLAGTTRDAFTQSFELTPTRKPHQELPLYYGLYPQEGKGQPFTVTAVGKLAGVPVLWRSASTSFPSSGPTRLLPLPLLAACANRTCDLGLTCQADTICRDDAVIVGDLPPYRKNGGGIVGEEPDADVTSPDGGTPAPDAAAALDGRAPPPVDGRAEDAPSPAPDGAPPPPPPDAQPPGLDTQPGPDRPPACVPQPEDCFNGLDDDCDSLIDCADADCAPVVAQCVASDPADPGMPGASVAAGAACPVNFDKAAAVTVRAGLTGAACAGCSCGPSAATCPPATIFSYQTPAACAGDTANGGGDPVVPGTLTAADGCKTPNYVTTPGGFIDGIRVAPMVPAMAACAPSGAATPGPATWAATAKFCPTVLRGGGCGVGQVCVPKLPAATSKLCAMYTGAHACPAGTTRLQNLDWYTGSTDTRLCDACTCGTPTGGSCAGISVQVGSDYSCGVNDGKVAPGGKVCVHTYSPGLQLSGAGTAGSCKAASATTGALTPTGRRSICCE